MSDNNISAYNALRNDVEGILDYIRALAENNYLAHDDESIIEDDVDGQRFLARHECFNVVADHLREVLESHPSLDKEIYD